MDVARWNTESVVLSAMVLVVSLGVNDLALSVFNRFIDKTRYEVMWKVLYVVIMLLLTVYVASWLNIKFKT